jgi:hypothetical protein
MRRVNHKAGFDATSSNCQKTLVSRLGPASNPNRNLPTMNMSDNSIRLFAMTTANNMYLVPY